MGSHTLVWLSDPIRASHPSMAEVRFDWDAQKDQANQKKHGVSFPQAQVAFLDTRRVIAEDLSHSGSEKRYFCFGSAGAEILTVRFTVRGKVIRVFGAGYWRKGKQIYERENQVHRRTPRKTPGRT